MREALSQAGLDRRVFAPGDVWLVPDEDVRLDPSSDRRFHENRTVIIIDGPERCADASLLSILAVPTSTRTDRRSRYQVTLERGGGLERSVAMLDLVQPFPRKSLRTKMGSITVEQLEILRAVLLGNLGILASSEESDVGF